MAEANNTDFGQAWKGGDKPFAASYGKLMMWFFLVTDALTFSGFLAAYGFSRFKYELSWPVPDEVFTHFPFFKGEYPLFFVALMTFILIMSSVTMVLAVNYGHKMKKKQVILWLSLTIIGGITFLGSQAWEWGHFIHGDKGAIITEEKEIIHLVNDEKEITSVYKFMGVDSYSKDRFSQMNYEQFVEKFKLQNKYKLKSSNKVILEHDDAVTLLESKGKDFVLGANLVKNEYGHALFADYFFFITGFHGFHVFSGVVLLIILLINVIANTYEKRGHYEMVEKIGLYWHFVDLVWVFVFTFFYLV
ncbi:MAG: cytochrome oxidase subunit III [Flavobacteriales bacterium TMED84]|nr:MAG: cytochrome oxidase subunit III [Flavobacteriales bacterium TMED84]